MFRFCSYGIDPHHERNMPDIHRPSRAYPGKREFSLADAAKIGQLVKMRCNLCRRTVYFLASDLAIIVGPDHPARAVPFPCSRCRKADYIDVKLHTPSADDFGYLLVRRPGAVKRTQTWRTMRLGDDPNTRQGNTVTNSGDQERKNE